MLQKSKRKNSYKNYKKGECDCSISKNECVSMGHKANMTSSIQQGKIYLVTSKGDEGEPLCIS